ncbi:unnamed protein product [Plutella xylostella]|uniref:(diamondback moth) hypothetical protein n=1 Tax=Plutella xylostella TaxID=51655 RepID=A0A8S4DTZ3_PLUXY|nr:unnamed protein product [Plutella xylostella]
MSEVLKREVQVFYEDDDNSRLCSGKKEFIVRNKTRKQKRYLNDSLLNLHKKFLKTTSLAISYPAFCKLRPFYVLVPDSKSRDTCLCTLHTNVELLIQGLYQRNIISTKTPQSLLSYLCCDPYNVDCLQRTCSVCKDKVVPYQEFDNSVDVVYWQWITKQDMISGLQKKIRTTEKQKVSQAPLICIDKLELILSEYFIHCANIAAQQQAFKALKTDLHDDEAIIHIDFSENYAVKCNQEIQSYHFGGSRKQITLHTAVLYIFPKYDTGEASAIFMHNK